MPEEQSKSPEKVGKDMEKNELGETADNKPKPVAIGELFYFATGTDKLLIMLGSFCSIGQG
jgi:hypothetical protein